MLEQMGIEFKVFINLFCFELKKVMEEDDIRRYSDFEDKSISLYETSKLSFFWLIKSSMIYGWANYNSLAEHKQLFYENGNLRLNKLFTGGEQIQKRRKSKNINLANVFWRVSWVPK